MDKDLPQIWTRHFVYVQFSCTFRGKSLQTMFELKRGEGQLKGGGSKCYK